MAQPRCDGAYNARGQVARKEFFDTQDRLVQIVYGYATQHYTYDNLGRETTPLFFDVHGAPVHTRVAVKEVEPDTAGERYGLQVGDILLSYDGEEVPDIRTFFNELELTKGERQRELRLQRQGQEIRLEVLPGRLTGLTLVNRVPPALTNERPGDERR